MALSGCLSDQGLNNKNVLVDQKHELLLLLLVILKNDGGSGLVVSLLSEPVLLLLACNIADKTQYYRLIPIAKQQFQR